MGFQDPAFEKIGFSPAGTLRRLKHRFQFEIIEMSSIATHILVISNFPYHALV